MRVLYRIKDFRHFYKREICAYHYLKILRTHSGGNREVILVIICLNYRDVAWLFVN